MEYKIGDIIKLEVVESPKNNCIDCFYAGTPFCHDLIKCSDNTRQDGKSVIYKEVK